jgi:DNA-binding NtrC family response regulator
MSDPYKILILDDDASMRDALSTLFAKAGWDCTTKARAEDAPNALRKGAFDVILSDMRMQGQSGLDLLRELGTDRPPFILISAHGDIPLAVQAMQEGAYSFFEKPFDPNRVLLAATHAAAQHRLSARNKRLEVRLASLSGLDRVLKGEAPAIVALRDEIMDLAGLDVPVMIVGETGTGKELVARALHDMSGVSGSFVAVDCTSVSAGQFERMMFGDAQGSDGYFALAGRGTVFLDELASLPEMDQAKLLRVLETREYAPVGLVETVEMTARVVSSVKSLDADVRDDLVFRLNTTSLNLPPLRERTDDIGLLFAHYLGRYAQVYEVASPEITAADIAALLAHEWPGNVRELRHVAERRVLDARRGRGSVAAALMLEDADDVPPTLREAVAVFERELIAKAVQAHGGRMDAVAESLGIGRRTLNEKIVKVGLDKDALL